MAHVTGRGAGVWRLIALALGTAIIAALSAQPAAAGTRVGIAVTPPTPVLSPPLAYIPQVVPGFPPPVAAPAPMAPLPPQVIYFTPPKVIPFIEHGRGDHNEKHRR